MNTIRKTHSCQQKRIIQNYTDREKEIIQCNKIIFNEQLKILKTNKCPIYENQELIASRVCCGFKDRKIINIMVLAKTQSGKTGSMAATISQYLHDPSNLIPINNIYIITGLSDCQWKEQTRERIPDQIKIFHRNDLARFATEIKDKKNILIIMDEIQVAAQKDQTIYKTFEKAGIFNKTILYENDIKILEYTATPDGTIYDHMKWEDASQKILADVGDGYTSSYDLLESGRVKQYKDLCGYDKKTKEINEEKVIDNIREIKNDIQKYSRPMYHIIRTKIGLEHSKTIENFKKVFNDNRYIFEYYNRDTDIEDINDLLKNQPERHTIIFIKEMLRCAKTLNKKHIGILYERYTNNQDDTVIIQGLLGRNTGYDDNNISICYTNIDTVERYEKLWESKFEDKTIEWNSKTTSCRKGIISSKGTFNDPKNFGFVIKEEKDIDETNIMEFKTQKDAIKFCKENLGTKLRERKDIVNGFYLATLRGIKKIFNVSEIKDNKGSGLNDNTKCRLYPCYKDVTKPETLLWIVCSKNTAKTISRTTSYSSDEIKSFSIKSSEKGCPYIYVKGDKKGEKCRTTPKNGVYCSKHKKYEESSSSRTT